MKLNPSLTRLYSTLKIGQYIFVEDDFVSAKSKTELLYDFTRMDATDRDALLREIPDGNATKSFLSQYAENSKTWIESIDFSTNPLGDIEFIIKRNFGEDSEAYKAYSSIGEEILVEPLLSVFTKFGVGITIPHAFLDLFDEIIRSNRHYLPTRVFLDYGEEIRAEIMTFIDAYWKTTHRSTVLVLDNIINSSRNAEQMIKDLLAFKEHHDAEVYAAIFSSAEQATSGENYSAEDCYISYVRKSPDISGLHRSIVHAAINLLMQKSKKKQVEILSNNYDTLAKNPELVDYLYSMAHAEGAPGFEIIQQWISNINSFEMENSEELKCLTKLSTCLEAYHDATESGKTVPPLLSEAAASEFFSNHINQYYTITAPGDIFIINGKYYVLVGQECDFMMGDSRKRDTPLCELLEAEAIPQNQYDKLVDTGSSVQISNFLTPDEQITTLKIKYNKRHYIRNEILNLCCFNPSGECMINPTAALSEDCKELIQPFLIDYYKKLQVLYLQLLDIREKYPDFDTILSGLNINAPLVDYSSCEKDGNTIKFPIKRYTRIKERASLYLNKMFLDYRGRIPYTSIHLLGYEVHSVVVKSGDLRGNVDVFIKQSAKRNKNRKPDKHTLPWYIKTKDIVKVFAEMGYECLSLEDYPDEYIELVGKSDQQIQTNDHCVVFSKKYSEEKNYLEIKVEDCVPV